MYITELAISRSHVGPPPFAHLHTNFAGMVTKSAIFFANRGNSLDPIRRRQFFAKSAHREICSLLLPLFLFAGNNFLQNQLSPIQGSSAPRRTRPKPKLGPIEKLAPWRTRSPTTVETGEEINTLLGIMQGDCLSAILFIVYLAQVMTPNMPIQLNPVPNSPRKPAHKEDHSYASKPHSPNHHKLSWLIQNMLMILHGSLFQLLQCHQIYPN